MRLPSGGLAFPGPPKGMVGMGSQPARPPQTRWGRGPPKGRCSHTPQGACLRPWDFSPLEPKQPTPASRGNRWRMAIAIHPYPFSLEGQETYAREPVTGTLSPKEEGARSPRVEPSPEPTRRPTRAYAKGM